VPDRRRGEFAENAIRKDSLPSEIDAIRKALEPLEKLAAKERMSEGGKVGKISTPSEAGKTRDKVGAFAGVTGRPKAYGIKAVATFLPVIAGRKPRKVATDTLADALPRQCSAPGLAWPALARGRRAGLALPPRITYRK
jgi:hypothetical protein